MSAAPAVTPMSDQERAVLGITEDNAHLHDTRTQACFAARQQRAAQKDRPDA